MNDIMVDGEFGELLMEYGDVPEVAALIEKLYSPEMLEKEIGSTDVKDFFTLLKSTLLMLDKNDAVKRGITKVN